MRVKEQRIELVYESTGAVERYTAGATSIAYGKNIPMDAGRSDSMVASGFSFEMENGKLAWTYPDNAPDVTEDQARTIATAMLATAIEKLAEAVERHANPKKDA